MSDVLRSILDYAKAPETDYALMITGPWGSGKTYFWEKVLAPKLKALRHPHKPLRLLYVSMYGVSDTRDFDRSLFAQSYPGIAHKRVGRISKLVGGVLEALGYADLAKVDLRNLIRTDGAIICFDDLERAEMPIRTALGYINTFVEHERLKTIVLCNEKAITGEAATWDEEDRETYNKMKEKVVGFTIDHQPNHQEITASLIAREKTKPEFQAFLEHNKELICQIFQNSETDNIRSLKRSIGALRTAYNALDWNNAASRDTLERQLIYALLPTAFELWAGRADGQKLRAIHSTAKALVALLSLGRMDADGEQQEEGYESKFRKRYFGEAALGEAVSSPAICDLLLTGYLDQEALSSDFADIQNPPSESSQRVRKLFWDFRELSNDEFKETVSGVFQDVSEGEFKSLESWPQLFDRFAWLSQDKLIEQDLDQLLALFTEALDRAVDQGQIAPSFFLEHEIDYSTGVVTDQGKEFRRRLLAANQKAFALQLHEQAQAAVQQMLEQPEVFARRLATDNEDGLCRTPIFHEIDPEVAAAEIVKWSNSLKRLLARALHVRYDKTPISSENCLELESLVKLQVALEKSCATMQPSSPPIPISLYILQQITATLGRAIEQMNALAPDGT